MSHVTQGAVDAAFNVAVRRYEAGDLDAAMDIFRALALIAPTDGGVWRALARCHEEVGEPEVAEKLRWLGRALTEGVS